MSSVYPSRKQAPDGLKPTSTDPIPVDADIPDNYVQYTLKREKGLPPVRLDNILNELNWLNVAILGLTPIVGFIGMCYTSLQWKTALFAAFYYYITGLGKFANTPKHRFP